MVKDPFPVFAFQFINDAPTSSLLMSLQLSKFCIKFLPLQKLLSQTVSDGGTNMVLKKRTLCLLLIFFLSFLFFVSDADHQRANAFSNQFIQSVRQGRMSLNSKPACNISDIITEKLMVYSVGKRIGLYEIFNMNLVLR